MGLRNRTLLTDERCFFITTTCYQHIPLLCTSSCFHLLFDSFQFYNEKYSAKLIAYVFMPNHIHFVIFFDGENRLIDYMRDFKKYTARVLREHLQDERPDLLRFIVHESNGQHHKIWNDRYDDVYLYSRQVCETKIAYIHSNPVRGGLVTEPIHYPYSSAAFYEGLRPHSALLHYRELF
ncbi:transposase [uncultured Spirosoma sp.]|uniref:REP-associated tyrosine transposase n=1 Tax=uncultured Spirosoma sp. TaxID=278208 RepID=UPI00258ECC42|nr:transposase [uncultured Spirosoma sp.]